MNAADRAHLLSTGWLLIAILVYLIAAMWAGLHFIVGLCLKSLLESAIVYVAGIFLAGFISLKSDQHFYPEARYRCYG